MKKSFLRALGAIIFCMSSANISAEISEDAAMEEIVLPDYFVIDRPFLKYLTSVKFKDQGVLIAGGVVDKLPNAKMGFVLWDPEGRPLAYAALYTLLPSQDPLFVIRDASEHVLGYLRVQDLSLLKLFKPLSTVLYSPKGSPLLKSVFWPCGFSFRVYDLRSEEKSPILKAYKCWSGNLEIDVKRPINVEPRMLLSMLQVLANRTVIQYSGDYLHTHASINIDDLEHYALASFAVVLPKDFIVEAEVSNVDLEPWLQLKELLGTSVVEMDGEEMAAIIESLAARFEDSEGCVNPYTVLNAVDQLSAEEKSVLIELLSTKFP